jgi:hypothetical protein
MLLDMVEIISNQLQNNINHLTVSTVGGIFRAIINVDVQTSEDIKTICEKLQAIDGIEHVNRINKA